MTHKSQFKCPACNTLLAMAANSGQRKLLWCEYGPCKSLAANRGAVGVNEQEAFNQLSDTIAEENTHE